MRERIVSASQSRRPADIQHFGDLPKSFRSSLQTHLLLCGWALENWGHYIQFLGTEMEKSSIKAINAPIAPGAEITPRDPGTDPVPADTEKVKRSRTATFESFRSTTFRSVVDKLKPRGSFKPPVQEANNRYEQRNIQQEFPFTDLQRLQYIYESVCMSSFAVKTNMEILKQLIKFYSKVTQFFNQKQGEKQRCEANLYAFQSRLDGMIDEFQVYQARLDTLAMSLLHRKTLVSC